MSDPADLAGAFREEDLAPYACRASESMGRRYDEGEHEYRTMYQRDRDRIVHATAFRRLQYKTQVFVNHEGDHYRTRLTHTLEVAQIGRTLARGLRLNEDLTEAIGLAHDLGHTPFGHSGEEALDRLMTDCDGFEHNGQGLRTVDLLEKRYVAFPGLNLSYELRESFVRHSTRHDRPRYAGEEFPDVVSPPLETQLIIVADEIAYDNHDLDDGLASGILDLDEVAQLGIWRKAAEIVRERTGVDGRAAPRSETIRALIDLEVTDILRRTAENIREHRIESRDDVRAAGRILVEASPDLTALKSELEEFLVEKFYRHHTVVRMANKAKSFLTDMFVAYTGDVRMLPEPHQRDADEYGVERAVCDYIAGMTDRFAQQEYRRLFHPFERT